MGFGKWLGGGLGWAIGGPVGGVLGFALGSLFDSSANTATNSSYSSGARSHRSFATSLIVLIAAVLKADGKVMQSELSYVKRFFVRQFGEAAAPEAMLLLRDVLNRPIPLYEVCAQIRLRMDIASRRELLHLLFGLAVADGDLDQREIATIQVIAIHLGLSTADFLSIKAMFTQSEDHDWAYKVLEISKNTTNEEVKKAYRNMAQKHHPDKVAQLGEDIQRAANEKFSKIKEAYEWIKKSRGME
jgi:DnaJ like chaperone protein